MRLDEFDYQLPSDLIAQEPLTERDSSRLMVLGRDAGTIENKSFREIAQILQPGDLLVFNNTKVIPARLLGRRRGTQSQQIGKHNPAVREFLSAEIELFLTRQESDGTWQALVRPGRKVRTGEILEFGEGELEAEVVGRGKFGMRLVRLKAPSGSVENAVDLLGHIPLPPYIQRPDCASDRETYQTIFAKVRGAVAAPTAGLHFTESILGALQARNIETCEITLHVGLGTFQPVRTEIAEEHKMEAERFEISDHTALAINRAMDGKRRIIAVGTTSVRTLEHAAREHGGRIAPGRGETSLYILPGYKFQVTSGLITNFHLPRSTLLMLVSAFAGREFVLSAYQHAVAERYRFYSYGDCMLIV